MKPVNFCRLSLIVLITCSFGSCKHHDDTPTVNTPKWKTTGQSYCSTDPNKIVGESGKYYFYQEQDENAVNPTYRWIRDANKDGLCAVGYIPVFKSTNITSGSYTSFALYGNDRVFAAETVSGILEYVNGNWVKPTGMSQAVYNDIYYAKMKQGAGGKFFISCAKGVYFQSGDNVYKQATSPWDNGDMAGALGGNDTNFFVSAGVGFHGIYKWDGTTSKFIPTNQTNGCFYSIESSGNDVFFGSYQKSDGTAGKTYGVVRYNASSGKIEPTNLSTGEYQLAAFNGKMYTSDGGLVHVWDGAKFSQIYDKGGILRSTGGALYLLTNNEIWIFDEKAKTFKSFLQGNYSDIVYSDGYTYVFGKTGVKALGNSTWLNVSSVVEVTTGIATTSGLFMGGTNNNKGIQIMDKVYN